MDPTRRQITKIARNAAHFAQSLARDKGLGPGEYEALHAIRKHPGIRPAELCEQLSLEKTAAAHLVRNLAQKGLILKKTDPADTRRRLYYPTPAADSLKDSRASLEVSYYSWLTEILSERDLSEFIRILDILYRRSKEARKAGGPAELLDQLPGHTERDD